MSKMPRGLGRIEVIDERDKQYPINEYLVEASTEEPQFSKRFWWADGWWGNQGSVPHCVAFAWSHFIEDGPVIQDGVTESRSKPMFNTSDLYNLCQLNDKYPGEDYDGTSIRAGAKILKNSGVIKSYRWAHSIEDVIATVKYIGPMVAGTKWYSGLSNGTDMRIEGRQQGGHAYLINGVDEDRGTFRVKNSWGRSWGNNGSGTMAIDTFEKLLNDGGEACIAFENKMDHVPLLLG